MKEQVLKKLSLSLFKEKLKSSMFIPKYEKSLLRAVNEFFKWSEEKDLADLRKVRKKDVLDYFLFLNEKLLSKTTIDTKLHAVKLLFSLLYISQMIDENPIHNLKFNASKKISFKRRPLTREEINTVLEDMNVESKKGLRDRCLFEVIYSTGLRVSEASKLKIGDIDFNSRLMRVEGKFQRQRIVPVSSVAAQFLKLYLEERKNRKDEHVFLGKRGEFKTESISRLFREYLKKYEHLNKKEISTHSIRHSTATHLLEEGMSIRHVQELLGHKKIRTTEIYTHVQNENLFKEYRKYHPREHQLFEAVDLEYIKKVNSLLEKM